MVDITGSWISDMELWPIHGDSGNWDARTVTEGHFVESRMGASTDALSVAPFPIAESARDFHPEPLTDPCLSLSTHTARAPH